MTITSLRASSDNYIHAISDSDSAIVVDPTSAKPVINFVRQSNLTLTHILITHHHSDHTAGCAELMALTNCKVIGPVTSATPLKEEDLPDGVEVMSTPGHTSTHTCYHFPQQKALFSGDTLFLGGCGRLFEGTPSQMWHSLLKLRELPPETEIYPGHDYTLDNLEFCQSILPDSAHISERIALIRSSDAPSHSSLATERLTNVFLMCDDPVFQNAAGLSGSPEDIFAELRRRKDSW